MTPGDPLCLLRSLSLYAYARAYTRVTPKTHRGSPGVIGF
jgi:hypothetical protein